MLSTRTILIPPLSYLNQITKPWFANVGVAPPNLNMTLVLIYCPFYLILGSSRSDHLFTSQVTFSVSDSCISIHNIIQHNMESPCPSLWSLSELCINPEWTPLTWYRVIIISLTHVIIYVTHFCSLYTRASRKITNT